MSRQRLSLTALLLLLAGPVLAQRFTAAIRGTVTDPSTAVIAGAKVTLKNEETGLARTVTTNEGLSKVEDPPGPFQGTPPAGEFTPELCDYRKASAKAVRYSVCDDV